MREEYGAGGNQREHDYRKASIVLLVLLLLCLAALGYTLARNHTMSAGRASAIAPDNVITTEQTSSTLTGKTPIMLTQTGHLRPQMLSASSNTPVQQTVSYEPAVQLYRGHVSGDLSFALENMLPGDKVSKEYTIEVSRQDAVTLYFIASAKPAAENSAVYKLEDVLHIKVSIPAADEVLYEGAISEMPRLPHRLTSRERTTDTVVYRVEVSLDSSLGNEYQGQRVTSNFRWWVFESDKLTEVDSSKTGDTSTMALWAGCIVISLAAAAVLLKKAKREGTAQ